MAKRRDPMEAALEAAGQTSLNRGGARCMTCPRPEFDRFFSRLLDRIEDPKYPQGYLSLAQIVELMKTHLDYPYDAGAFMRHLRNHRREMWERFKRAQEGR